MNLRVMQYRYIGENTSERYVLKFTHLMTLVYQINCLDLTMVDAGQFISNDRGRTPTDAVVVYFRAL